MRTLLLWLLALGLSALASVGGCTTSERAGGDASTDSTAMREASDPPGPDLAPQSDQIQTVQLYQGSEEQSLPITSLRAEGPLTLEFDLMQREGRPLTAHFHHANRSWERDLSPSQVMGSYHDDDLNDYRASQGTAVSYVHYNYRFPNDDIRFRVSGNYVLRVTEQGRPDSVLFERPFFVTDQEGTLETGIESVVAPGQRQSSVRPVARFEPPAALGGNPFGYAVCFVRNGRLPDARCKDRPLVGQQPKLQFELDRTRAFAPTTADYTVDLSNLRGGPEIERTDRTVSPARVLLEPDYARFGPRTATASLQGQVVVREALSGYANPALRAEYVRTTFAFRPPEEQPFRGDVVVTGSFSSMDPAQGTTMTWQAARGRYEGEVLLKQGHHQYYYKVSDPRWKQSIQQSRRRPQNTYTTFVYYQDPRLGTDRLLRVNSFQR